MLWWSSLAITCTFIISYLGEFPRSGITGSETYHLCNFMHIAKLPSRKAATISIPTASTREYGWAFLWSTLCDLAFASLVVKMMYNVNFKYFKGNPHCLNNPTHMES